MSADLKEPFRPSWNPDNVFAGTAWYYARYRPSYPDEVIHLLVERFRLDKKSRVLDLGCGTGQVASKLAPHVAEVVAVDPQEEMLREGKLAAAYRGISNVIWMKGESGDLPRLTKKIGNINFTVIARAFHWMNREQTLHDLFKITVPGGGVAVISDSGPYHRAMIPWKETIQQTVKKWLGEERKAGTEGTFSHTKKRFETYLKESEFGNYEEATCVIERSWSLDEIIGYMYSTSSASPPVLGDKKDAFEADLRERLLEIEPAGRFKEPVEIVVNMVWKKHIIKKRRHDDESR
jgi:ubiquinone/menaquinone biosynthesis C-methylase UbiE